MLVSQSHLTLCNSMDYSWPGSSVHEIFQIRILEWVAMPFSRGSPQPRDQTQSLALQADSLPSEPPMCLKKVKLPSRVRLFVISWTVAYQAPPSMEFSRQEYWSGLLFPSPGDLPDVGNKLFPIWATREALCSLFKELKLSFLKQLKYNSKSS